MLNVIWNLTLTALGLIALQLVVIVRGEKRRGEKKRRRQNWLFRELNPSKLALLISIVTVILLFRYTRPVGS